jgi:hypothetical protein
LKFIAIFVCELAWYIGILIAETFWIISSDWSFKIRKNIFGVISVVGLQLKNSPSPVVSMTHLSFNLVITDTNWNWNKF